MPLAFFGTFFRVERKYYPLGAAAPPSAPESARHPPGEGSLTDKLAYIDACRGLSTRPLPPSVRPPKQTNATHER